MTGSRHSAARRDDHAADRDDVAARRDITATARDDAADERDTQASERSDDTRRDLADLDDRLVTIREQIIDHLAHVENSDVDPANWPDLTPDDLSRLRALLAAQRHLAARDREAITNLIRDLRSTLRHLLGDGVEASADRHAAARDRHQSAGDRDASASDRAPVSRGPGPVRHRASAGRSARSRPRRLHPTEAGSPANPYSTRTRRVPTTHRAQPRTALPLRPAP